jgi:hypothetical protein
MVEIAKDFNISNVGLARRGAHAKPTPFRAALSYTKGEAWNAE